MGERESGKGEKEEKTVKVRKKVVQETKEEIK